MARTRARSQACTVLPRLMSLVHAGGDADAGAGVTHRAGDTVRVRDARPVGKADAVWRNDHVFAGLNRRLVQSALADRGVATGGAQVLAGRARGGRIKGRWGWG